jgi:LacI family transcriptional regulator
MRVTELAKELKYERNETAIFFKQRKTFTMELFFSFRIFILISYQQDEDFAKTKNYIVLVGQSHDVR